jgi:uncharacterized protein YqeY
VADGLRDRLREALRAAMKARDKPAIAGLRAALSVIDNAEAADLSDAPAVEEGHIAGGVAGIGAGEVERRELTDVELVALLDVELTCWESTAQDYERLQRSDDAGRLRAEIAAVRVATARGRRGRRATDADGPTAAAARSLPLDGDRDHPRPKNA